MAEPYRVPEEDERAPMPAETLLDYAEMDNIASALSDDVLASIGARAVSEYNVDHESMSEWRERYDEGMGIAMQRRDKKTNPWPNASNIKLPIIAQAAVRFGAEAYAELIRGDDIVKVAYPGLNLSKEPDGENDPQAALYQRGGRIKEHMNYQLLSEMQNWEPDMDRLTVMLPLVGCLLKKTWFDPVDGHPVCDLVMPDEVAVNQAARSLEDAMRVTQALTLSGNEVHERVQMGLFLPCDLGDSVKEGSAPEDRLHDFLEQHRFLDLDDDGYEEPYIVTVHKESGKVCRIVARFTEDDILVNQMGEIVRIKPLHYWTKYSFIPSPDGSFWDIGWAHMLGPLAETANTLYNQLVDAGSLANGGGGMFDKGIRIKEGEIRVQPGKYIPVNGNGRDLRGAMVPWPFKEPSATLFALLEMTVQMAEKLASMTDVVTGSDIPANMPATTVLAMVEQGRRVNSAILKRIHRSMKSEMRKLYRMNRLYTDPAKYQQLLNVPADPYQDYAEDDFDVLPVTDPELSSRMQRIQQAEALMALQGAPGADPVEITRRYVDALGIDDPEQVVPPPNPVMEQHQTQMAQANMELEAKQIQAANLALDLGVVKTRAEADEMIGKAMRERAEAMRVAAEAEQSERKMEAETAKEEAEAELAALKALDFAQYGNPERIDKSNSN